MNIFVDGSEITYLKCTGTKNGIWQMPFLVHYIYVITVCKLFCANFRPNYHSDWNKIPTKTDGNGDQN